MISSISAEFETQDLAEIALKKVRERYSGIYSATIKNRPNRPARNGFLPDAVSSHGFMAAVLGSPVDESDIPEPFRSRAANIYIVCERSCTNDIAAILSAMGGLKIQYSK